MSPAGQRPGVTGTRRLDHVALLRGVNVGGRNKLSMSDFRVCLEAVGCQEVVTYVQSGNAAFYWDGAGTADLSTAIATELARRTSTVCGVVVIDAYRLHRIVAANPFSDEPDPKKVHVVFTSEPVDEERAGQVAGALARARERGDGDEAVIAAGALFLHTPAGFGRSPLAAELAKLRPGGTWTARNWGTVSHLAGLLAP